MFANCFCEQSNKQGIELTQCAKIDDLSDRTDQHNVREKHKTDYPTCVRWRIIGELLCRIMLDNFFLPFYLVLKFLHEDGEFEHPKRESECFGKSWVWYAFNCVRRQDNEEIDPKT